MKSKNIRKLKGEIDKLLDSYREDDLYEQCEAVVEKWAKKDTFDSKWQNKILKWVKSVIKQIDIDYEVVESTSTNNVMVNSWVYHDGNDQMGLVLGIIRNKKTKEEEILIMTDEDTDEYFFTTLTTKDALEDEINPDDSVNPKYIYNPFSNHCFAPRQVLMIHELQTLFFRQGEYKYSETEAEILPHLPEKAGYVDRHLYLDDSKWAMVGYRMEDKKHLLFLHNDVENKIHVMEMTDEKVKKLRYGYGYRLDHEFIILAFLFEVLHYSKPELQKVKDALYADKKILKRYQNGFNEVLQAYIRREIDFEKGLRKKMKELSKK